MTGRSSLLAAMCALVIGAGAAHAAPGDLDASFGQGGQRFTGNILQSLGEDGTSMSALRRLPDGRLVVLGTLRCSQDCYEQLVARYTPAGAPDLTMGRPGSPGVAVFPGTDRDFGDGTTATGLALRPDGGVVLGYAFGPSGSRLVRVPPDGVSGPAEIPVSEPLSPLTVLADGRLLAQTQGGTVVLLGPDGTTDPVVGGGAPVPIPAVGPLRAAESGGAVLVGGSDLHGLVLVRIPLDGSAATHSRVPLPQPPNRAPRQALGIRDLVVAPDGRALVLADMHRPGAAFRRVVGAFDRRGQADMRFGNGGVLALAGGDSRLALQRDGRVVVAHSTSAAREGERPRLVVRRLDARGRADRSFPIRRLRTVAREFYGLDVVVDERGRIVVAAGAFRTYGESGLLLVRLHGREAPSVRLSAAQLRINQRISQAAVRRLGALEAAIAGRPAPAVGRGRGGRVTLTARQLRINQRISQAAVRRANALSARLDGRPEPDAGSGGRGRVTLSAHQLQVNQRISQAAVRRANALQERVPELPVPRPPVGSPGLDRVVATALTPRTATITRVERGAATVGEVVALILPESVAAAPGETVVAEGVVRGGVLYGFHVAVGPAP